MSSDSKRIVITDSGLGGVNIAANLYEKLKTISLPFDVEIIFINVLPEAGKGFNQMPDTATKVKTFNEILEYIESNFNPFIIGIGCNTLSVLLNQTDFYKNHSEEIYDVVQAGIDSFINNYSKNSKSYITIFGSKTTINSNAHRNLLIDKGAPTDTIIPQECVHLASQIELDYKSKKVRDIVESGIKKTLNKVPEKDSKIYCYLACTHYGYIADLFLNSFLKFGYSNVEIINPNDYLVNVLENELGNLETSSEDILHKPERHSNVKIAVHSRCKILPQEIKSISNLIISFSLDTGKALRNYILIRSN